MKRVLFLILAMFQFIGCSAHNYEGLVRFSYSDSNGMVMYSGESYEVYVDDNGKVHIDIDENRFNEKKIVTDYTQVFHDLQKIVDKYKMYKWKGSYTPVFEVMDGDNWSFGLRYSDGKTVSASGYMAWPKHFRDALEEIGNYFNAWRIMPLKHGKVSAEEAEAFLANFNKIIDSEMTSFRYERYDNNKSKVYFVSKAERFTGFYHRPWGSNEGFYCSCANPEVLKKLKKVVDEERLAGFPQTPIDKENKRHSRWIVEAEFADGSKIEIVDYIPENSMDYDRRIERRVDELIDEELKAIRAKSPEEMGEYSITTYGAGGKPQRKINYDGEGRVLNGIDYNNPMLDF